MAAKILKPLAFTAALTIASLPGFAINDYNEDTHGAGTVRFDTNVAGGPTREEGKRTGTP